MNKRGATQKTLIFIFYLLIAFIIIYSSSRYLGDYFNGMEFNKEFLAIDTISFSPNNIEMKYTPSHEIRAESKDFRLNIKLKDLEFSKEYNFISNIKDFSIKSEEITVKKQNNKLTIK